MSCFWYSGANQIRTIFLFSQSGFYIIKCDCVCAILVVKGNDQLIIVEINSIDEGIDQPLAVGLFAHIQHTELVQIEKDLFLRQLWLGNLLVGDFDFQFFLRRL